MLVLRTFPRSSLSTFVRLISPSIGNQRFHSLLPPFLREVSVKSSERKKPELGFVLFLRSINQAEADTSRGNH